MKYQGSKRRIGNEIFSIIYQENPNIKNWVEPFVGGANMIDKVPKNINRIGYDNNKYVVEMFKELQKGFIPPDTITEEQYLDIKNNKDKYPMALVGFVGITCSFAGKWFGGYARWGLTNYCMVGKKSVLKQRENILDVSFSHGDYRDIPIMSFNPDETVIYCDPPYKNTTKYHTKFNHTDFWNWANKISEHYKIYVSEYEAPDGWICIFEKEIKTGLDRKVKDKTATERLFTR